jgi:hypothetical protein
LFFDKFEKKKFLQDNTIVSYVFKKMYLMINAAETRWNAQCNSRTLPVMSFNIEQEMNPKDKPSVILSEKGMIERVKKEGSASVGSSHFIFRTLKIIMLPTIMRAGAIIG